jgi:hypothetical protein
MPVDAAEIAELRRMKAAMSPEEFYDLGECSVLQSTEEVIGYMIAEARLSGWDESDQVETLVRLLELPPDEVRGIERVLRPLGYRDVCARLRQIAGRRKNSLMPLP